MIDTAPIESPDQEGLRASPAESGGEEAGEAFIEDIIESPATTATVAEPAAPDPAMTAESHTREVPPERPALDSRGVPVAWLLQVASVSSAAKADELRDQLLVTREKAFVKKFTQSGKVFYRVYVGPNFERAQLEKIQADIDTRFKVHSLIVRYTP